MTLIKLKTFKSSALLIAIGPSVEVLFSQMQGLEYCLILHYLIMADHNNKLTNSLKLMLATAGGPSTGLDATRAAPGPVSGT